MNRKTAWEGEAVSRPNKETVNGQDNRKSGAFIRG